MTRHLGIPFAIWLGAAAALAQDNAAPPTPIPSSTPVVMPTEPKRGFFGRMLHPFSSSAKTPPKYKNKKLEGLLVDVEVSPQPVKLSETRQLGVKVTVSNQGKRTITLDFPTEQRIEIYLMTSEQEVLTKWSENRVFDNKPGTVLVNPGEHVEYNETISTRDLTPNKVYIVEVFMPKYSEVRARQKFMTAP